MASLTVPRLITAEEFAHLDETLGFREELIEGERVLSPSPVFAHSVVLDRIAEILNRQLSAFGSQPLRIMQETGWKFNNPTGVESVPVPDLMVIRAEDAHRALKNQSWFEGVPLLVIEVVSPSERKSRRLQKIGLYLEMGAPFVVEVDYTKRMLRVHTPESDLPVVYRKGDELTVPFRARVDEIFADLDDAQA